MPGPNELKVRDREARRWAIHAAKATPDRGPYKLSYWTNTEGGVVHHQASTD